MVIPDYVESAVGSLPARDRATFLGAVASYMLDGTVPEMNRTLSFGFDLIRDRLDGLVRNRENGSKGGRPKTKTATQDVTESLTEAVTQDVTDRPDAAKPAGEPKRNPKGEGEGEVQETPPDCGVERPRRAARFSPPSAGEVTAYAAERGLALDTTRFCDFYASKGWKVGSSPMRDWKAAARNWAARDRTTSKGATPDASRFEQYR